MSLIGAARAAIVPPVPTGAVATGNSRLNERLDRAPIILVLLAAVALAVRIGGLGDPFYRIDESFYLLAGDRLLHGALPYVDIWDRKPIGLFLIYAAARALPGDGVIAYQLLATASVVATAWVVTRIARRLADARGALCGGVLYILGCQMLDGGGGQSPVFYDLPVAIAALLTFDRMRGAPGPRRRGIFAMLLMGVALQIKYSVLFEGAFMGCAWLCADRRAGRGWPGLAADAIGYGLAGLAPTLAVMAFYALDGHFAAFWYANFVSITHRAPLEAGVAPVNLLLDLAQASPLLVLALPALIGARRGDGIGFLRGWTLAALIGFCSVGYYFAHYALPLVAPLSASAATLCRRNGRRKHLVTLLAVAIPLWLLPGALAANAADRGLGRDLVALIRPHARDCALVLSRHMSLYALADTCGVTPYLFADHLLVRREHRALGVDQFAALRRALDRRPGTIIVADHPFPDMEPRNEALLRGRLRSDYIAIYVDRWHPAATAGTAIVAYRRRDLTMR